MEALNFIVHEVHFYIKGIWDSERDWVFSEPELWELKPEPWSFLGNGGEAGWVGRGLGKDWRGNSLAALKREKREAEQWEFVNFIQFEKKKTL